jgi:salicylate hydroxylase
MDFHTWMRCSPTGPIFLSPNMEIIVIGAGIGGLSAALSLALAGHHVTIFETASALAEIGAGVQLTPNATKYFWKWGLGPDILAKAALPTHFAVRGGLNGETLGRVEFANFKELYGAPYLVIHRADIHQILHEHSIKAGVNLRLRSRVIQYDFENAEVVLADGQKFRADLVVGVDGINSSARKALLNSTGDDLEKTGWAAYRAVAPVDKIKANPLTAHLGSQHSCNCWVGENCSAMTYMVKNSEILNIVLSHPDDVDTSEWAPEQYQAEIRRIFKGFNPSLTALLDMTRPGIQNWPIHQVKPLPKWTSATGKFVLMGDAAHAMAFYMSMGVSLAVEDAAALTECIYLQSQGNVGLDRAMAVFETVRKTRCKDVQDASLHAGNVLHLPPGPAQVARDAAMQNDGLSAEVNKKERFYAEGTSYGIADRKIRDWGYAYDVIEAVREEWNKFDIGSNDKEVQFTL